MIIAYIFDVTKINENDYKEFYNIISEKRQKKADLYTSKESTIRCVMAEIMIKYALKQEGCDNCFEVRQNSHGKPYFENIPNIKFNVSHSGKWVTVAISNSEVGVDVEYILRDADKRGIANRFFSEKERKYIFSAKTDAEENINWTQIWTLKESYIKYLGKGLSKKLNSFEIVRVKTGFSVNDSENNADKTFFNTFLLDDDYVLSVCGEENEVKIKNIELCKLKELI